MSRITIKTNRGKFDIEPLNESYVNYSLMEEDKMEIRFVSGTALNIPIGSMCEVEGKVWELAEPCNIKMVNSHNYEFIARFTTYGGRLKEYLFKNIVDGDVVFSMTATAREHLTLLINNLNSKEGESGWTIGECIDSTIQNINYDKNNCWQVLKTIATKFNTEFEIVNKTISLRKVEYNKTEPYSLAYGYEKGFLSGVSTMAEGNKVVKYLYVQGGDRNIDFSKYKTKSLRLPKNATIYFNGVEFGNSGNTYKTDEKGQYVYRADSKHRGEGAYVNTDVYPRREGVVGEVIERNVAKGYFDIVDDTIPATLDYFKCRAKGEQNTLMVIFQSGELAGREFEVAYFHNEKEDRKGRRFELTPINDNGIIIPNETLKPRQGDKYAVFNCYLPNEYVESAEQELLKESVKKLYENEEPRLTFKGELDPLFIKKNVSFRRFLKIGGYVSFSDSRLIDKSVLLRIQSIKINVNDNLDIKVQLTNTPINVGVGLATTIREVKGQERVIKEQKKELKNYTDRKFNNVEETTKTIISSKLEGFGEQITPIAMKTMQVMVGSDNLQFRFLKNGSREVLSFSPITIREDELLNLPNVILQHYTITDSTDIRPTTEPKRYREWNVEKLQNEDIREHKQDFVYIYVKADKISNNALYITSIIPKPLTIPGDDNYYFLVGYYDKSDEQGQRQFIQLYGYTEILPTRITTDKIVASGGASYFDLVNNSLKLGDSLIYENGKLIIKGSELQDSKGQKLGLDSLDYLKKALPKSTEIDGGVILSNVVGVKGDNNNVTSYISGLGNHAFCAGVTNFGRNDEKQVVYIDNNGVTKIGRMHFDMQGGKEVDTISILDDVGKSRVEFSINQIDTIDKFVYASNHEASGSKSIYREGKELLISNVYEGSDITINITGDLALFTKSYVFENISDDDFYIAIGTNSEGGLAQHKDWMNRTITYTLRLELVDMANSVVYSQDFKIQKVDRPEARYWEYHTEYYFEDSRDNYASSSISANPTIRINRGGSYSIRASVIKKMDWLYNENLGQFTHVGVQSVEQCVKDFSFRANVSAHAQYIVNKRATLIGNNGISAYNNKDHYFHVNTDDTANVVSVRGGLDIDTINGGTPQNAIWQAYVDYEGNIICQNGELSKTNSRIRIGMPSMGIYKVYFPTNNIIQDGGYIVHVTSCENRNAYKKGAYISVSEMKKDHFTVVIESNGSAYRTDFYFEVIDVRNWKKGDKVY